MSEPEPVHRASLLISIAAFVVIVAGMRAASGLFVPFLLSIFISVISFPVLDWLHARGVPQALALLIVIFGVALIGFGLSMMIAGSVEDFTRAIPAYQARLGEEMNALLAWLQQRGIEVPAESVQSILDPAAAMRLASTLVSALNAALSNAFLILLTVSFILMEAWNIPDKLKVALPNADRTQLYLNALSVKVRQYVGIKTMVSLVTGILIAIWLALIGVDFAVLWGLLAFLLNFVPTVGSIIAGVPAVLLALVQDGAGLALLAALGFLVTNVAVGNVIEPRVMGAGLGLSPLVVFLSLVFWGWVFGPIGMLLSIPLTMVLKVALEAGESTRWLSVLMGPNPKPAAAIMAADDSGAEQ